MKSWSIIIITVLVACSVNKENHKPIKVRLVTVDPGHFHAALVQKTMYEEVDSVVSVYAPPGNDVELHLKRIEGFNNRQENPTYWKEEVYTGMDFFDKMLQDKQGNVVVLAGNNQKKTEYILQCIQNGFNVLAYDIQSLYH